MAHAKWYKVNEQVKKKGKRLVFCTNSIENSGKESLIMLLVSEPLCLSCANFKNGPQHIGGTASCSAYARIPYSIYPMGDDCSYFSPKGISKKAGVKKKLG